MIGITQLRRIWTATEVRPYQLGQIVDKAEGVNGIFKYVRYRAGAGAVRGIQGMNVEYAKPATSTNDTDTSGEPGKTTVTADTSVATNLTAGVLLGDSPLGFFGGGVFADDTYGFIQLAGEAIVDIWMAEAATPAIAIAQDELIIPHSTNDGISDGVGLGSASATNLHQAFGYALADGELIVNDQVLVTFASALTGTSRYVVGDVVTATGTGASGTGKVLQIFSSWANGAESQWGMILKGTSLIIATSGNTTLTGVIQGATAFALARFSGRIKGKNVKLTLPTT